MSFTDILRWLWKNEYIIRTIIMTLTLTCSTLSVVISITRSLTWAIISCILIIVTFLLFISYCCSCIHHKCYGFEIELSSLDDDDELNFQKDDIDTQFLLNKPKK
jgi:hypothetical protein